MNAGGGGGGDDDDDDDTSGSVCTPGTGADTDHSRVLGSDDTADEDEDDGGDGDDDVERVFVDEHDNDEYFRDDEDNDDDEYRSDANGRAQQALPPRDDAIRVLRFHEAPVYAVGAEPGYVVSGGGDDCAVLWRLDEGTLHSTTASGSVAQPVLPHVVGRFNDSVVAVATCRDRFAVGCMDGALVAYQLTAAATAETAAAPATKKTETAAVAHAPSSGDGDKSIAAAAGGNVAGDTAISVTLDGPQDAIECVRWCDRDTLLCGVADGTAWLFDIADATTADAPTLSATCRAVLVGHRAAVTEVAFVGDARDATVLTASADGTVRVWRAADGAVLGEVQGHAHTAPILAMATRGALVLTGDECGAVALSNWQTRKQLSVLSVGGRRDDAGAGSVGTAAASSSSAALVPTHHGSVEGVAIGDEYMASADVEGRILVYNIADGGSLRTQFAHDTEAVVKCAWHPQLPPALVTASADRTVRVWDARAGQQCATAARVYCGHEHAILAMAVCARFAATASDDRTVRLFPLE